VTRPFPITALIEQLWPVGISLKHSGIKDDWLDVGDPTS